MATRVVYRGGVVYKMGCGITCHIRYTYTVDVYFEVPGIMYYVYSTEKNKSGHIKAPCRYGEHWGVISFPTCSWRMESGPQEGLLEVVRYSPRAVPTRLFK